MKYFVFSDLHSCINELKDGLKKVGYDEDNSEHKLLFLGDAFDKGNKHYETYKYIESSINKNKFIWVLGNHDYYLLNSLLKGKVSSFTKDTIRDIACGIDNSAVNYSYDDCVNLLNDYGIQEFIKENTVNYFETDNHVFVHGFIPFDKINNKYNENWRSSNQTEWNKANNLNGMKMVINGVRIPNKTLVCGHTGTIKMHKSYETFYYDGVIGLDGNCYKSGILNIIVIEE